MPGSFKENRGDGPSSTSSTNSANTQAAAMRNSNTNPHAQNYQVAGPAIGGAPTPYNSHNIEVAKEHLANSLNGDNDNSNLNVASTGGHTRRRSITETVIQGAEAAATGAVAAGATVIAAARKILHTDDDEAPVEQAKVVSNNLELNAPKKMNPGDRPPIKVALFPKKPSDIATYGNLDSPGAHTTVGPLSDRARSGTPPVPAPVPAPASDVSLSNILGPVKVTNWNDGKREQDVSTPTSEDFEALFDGRPLRDTPLHYSTAPSQAGGYFHPSARGQSPLKNEVAHAPASNNIHNHNNGHSPLR
ncbi:hypothetical protein BGZ94_002842, partial [Podila epigama]